MPNTYTYAYFVNCIVAYGVGSPYFQSDRIVFKTNKQISEQYPTLVTPAGWAFAVWGVIFVLQGISVFWMENEMLSKPCLEQGGYFWLGACFLQSCWTMAFALDKIPISMALMFGIFVSIHACYSEYKQCIAPSEDMTDGHYLQYILGVLPYCIHCAWVCAATIISVNITAVYYHVSSSTLLQLAWGSEVATVVFALGLSFWHKEPVFALVGAWALKAISAFEQPNSIQRQFTPNDRTRLRQFALLSSIGLLVNGLFHIMFLAYMKSN